MSVSLGLRRRVMVGFLCVLLGFTAQTAATANELLVVTIDGSINPASADHLIGAIERAEAENAAGVLIELDTPGGLVSATQDIIKAMLNSTVPTIVFVTPRGASATSAGTFITLAANVAAMMPGTSIGAAHPVSLFGGGESPSAPGGGEDGGAVSDKAIVEQKIENYLAAYVESIAKQRNRNVEWAGEAVRNSVAVTAEEALELNVIDLMAGSRAELIASISGRIVKLNDVERELDLANVTLVPIEMTLLQSIFNFLSDPNVATLLLAIGAIGLYMEFQSPGMIIPGATGVAAFVLLGFALQILPFSWVGGLLVLIGVGLLIAELFITSFGVLFAAGVTCFLVGGTMVFDRPEVSDLTVSFWEVLVPITAAMTVLGLLIVYSLGRTFRAEQTAGVDEMIGLVGRCESAIDPKGKVFVRGEYWNSVADETIRAGDSVEILEVKGLTLRVRRVLSEA
ncbi:MAG TPA: nodulation protein NfeD [Myxococcales bacterium]|nr:nodulation protein NfeD [Myxococcales bacterium]HIK86847.1 nodulation protein NfeD [Myxococcales bacterium]